MNNDEVTSYNQVLTVQPKIGPIDIPFRTYRRSWGCDADSDLASEWFGEVCVARRAFAADVKEVRRRVVSMGNEPEPNCTCVSQLKISEIDVRRIVKEILVGMRRSPERHTRFPRTRFVSCSSTSSGCSSSPCSPGRVTDLPRHCDGMYRQTHASTISSKSSVSTLEPQSVYCQNYSYAADFLPEARSSPINDCRRNNTIQLTDLPRRCDGTHCQTRASTCSSKSSVHTLEPKSGYCQNHPYAADFLPEVHSSPINDYRSNSTLQFDCSTPLNWPFPLHSPITSIWSSSNRCPKCITTFDKDSLNSTLSTDSLNDISIFSLDSLNSLTDKDSLEYANTTFSDDSLDSIDSCCHYDSLSDSKDSGFFSCSLPAVC